MSPKAKHELAREHVTIAAEDLGDSRDKEAINALFYAAEAAIVSLADAHGLKTKKRHDLKADAATALFEQGALDHDYGALLKQLNQARKDVWYEGEELELDAPIEDVLADIEALVTEAEKAA